MSDADSSIAFQLSVGELSRQELRAALDEKGVRLNASAEDLLNSTIFDEQKFETFNVVRRTVEQLGIRNGATLPAIFASAREAGLSLCPNNTGPYLRLSLTEQVSARDSIMSNGSAPSDSITVASSYLENNDDFPKGFYLRAVKGVLWLRGYHATEAHIWSLGDCFVFKERGPTT